MVELIKEFVVNFELSRNAKKPRFSMRPSQQKKNQNNTSIGNLQNTDICDFTISEF